ncbi:MAG TPA: hypothetical protein VGK92_13675 [Gaiellales bacterium]
MQGTPTPGMRITIDRASGGYRVHVWALPHEELLFWSDIYASQQGAQRAAFQLKSYAGSAQIEDLTATGDAAVARL